MEIIGSWVNNREILMEEIDRVLRRIQLVWDFLPISVENLRKKIRICWKIAIFS